MEQNVVQLERRRRGKCTQLKCACCCGFKRKDETRSCEKCRHLERGTHVPVGGIPQREEAELVCTGAKAR